MNPFTTDSPGRNRLPATLLLAAALSASPAVLTAQPAPLQGLNDYVERGMADWGIPGLAMAVVKDDQVVFARGYGKLGLEDPRPVDEHTVFGIASVSKAFTAAAWGSSWTKASSAGTTRWSSGKDPGASGRAARPSSTADPSGGWRSRPGRTSHGSGTGAAG